MELRDSSTSAYAVRGFLFFAQSLNICPAFTRQKVHHERSRNFAADTVRFFGIVDRAYPWLRERLIRQTGVNGGADQVKGVTG